MRYFLSIALAILFCSQGSFCQQNISITPLPGNIFIERGENKQIINVDFLVSNSSDDTLTLMKLSLSVFDKSDNLVHSRFLDNNGTAPGILLVPGRIFNGPSAQLIFNPFTEFTASMPLHKLVYEWTFEGKKEQEIKLQSVISPVTYVQKEKFIFPLKGKLLVYDAHDLYAHHRRFDFEFAPIKGLGFTANFMRYAYDFVLLESGKQFKTDGKKDEDFIGWGKAVYAVAAGKVIYAAASFKDDHTFDIPALAGNPMELYGNCLAIQHADESVSIYGHLKEKSISLKSGDRVKAGQEIGAIGASGSSFFPHLHFEVRTSIKHSAEGLPSYFSNVYLVEGVQKIKLKSGLVETGNIIEAK